MTDNRDVPDGGLGDRTSETRPVVETKAEQEERQEGARDEGSRPTIWPGPRVLPVTVWLRAGDERAAQVVDRRVSAAWDALSGGRRGKSVWFRLRPVPEPVAKETLRRLVKRASRGTTALSMDPLVGEFPLPRGELDREVSGHAPPATWDELEASVLAVVKRGSSGGDEGAVLFYAVMSSVCETLSPEGAGRQYEIARANARAAGAPSVKEVVTAGGGGGNTGLYLLVQAVPREWDHRNGGGWVWRSVAAINVYREERATPCRVAMAVGGGLDLASCLPPETAPGLSEATWVRGENVAAGGEVDVLPESDGTYTALGREAGKRYPLVLGAFLEAGAAALSPLATVSLSVDRVVCTVESGPGSSARLLPSRALAKGIPARSAFVRWLHPPAWRGSMQTADVAAVAPRGLYGEFVCEITVPGATPGRAAFLVTAKRETCSRCGRHFRADSNDHGSCRWHTAPPPKDRAQQPAGHALARGRGTGRRPVYARVAALPPGARRDALEANFADLERCLSGTGFGWKDVPKGGDAGPGPFDLVGYLRTGLTEADYETGFLWKKVKGLCPRGREVARRLLDPSRRAGGCFENEPLSDFLEPGTAPADQCGLVPHGRARVWSCCGSGEEDAGCWVGRHSSGSPSPDFHDQLKEPPVRGTERRGSLAANTAMHDRIVMAHARGEAARVLALERVFNTDARGALVSGAPLSTLKSGGFWKRELDVAYRARALRATYSPLSEPSLKDVAEMHAFLTEAKKMDNAAWSRTRPLAPGRDRENKPAQPPEGRETRQSYGGAGRGGMRHGDERPGAALAEKSTEADGLEESLLRRPRAPAARSSERAAPIPFPPTTPVLPLSAFWRKWFGESQDFPAQGGYAVKRMARFAAVVEATRLLEEAGAAGTAVEDAFWSVRRAPSSEEAVTFLVEDAFWDAVSGETRAVLRDSERLPDRAVAEEAARVLASAVKESGIVAEARRDLGFALGVRSFYLAGGPVAGAGAASRSTREITTGEAEKLRDRLLAVGTLVPDGRSDAPEWAHGVYRDLSEASLALSSAEKAVEASNTAAAEGVLSLAADEPQAAASADPAGGGGPLQKAVARARRLGAGDAVKAAALVSRLVDLEALRRGHAAVEAARSALAYAATNACATLLLVPHLSELAEALTRETRGRIAEALDRVGPDALETVRKGLAREGKAPASTTESRPSVEFRGTSFQLSDLVDESAVALKAGVYRVCKALSQPSVSREVSFGAFCEFATAQVPAFVAAYARALARQASAAEEGLSATRAMPARPALGGATAPGKEAQIRKEIAEIIRFELAILLRGEDGESWPEWTGAKSVPLPVKTLWLGGFMREFESGVESPGPFSHVRNSPYCAHHAFPWYTEYVAGAMDLDSAFQTLLEGMAVYLAPAETLWQDLDARGADWRECLRDGARPDEWAKDNSEGISQLIQDKIGALTSRVDTLLEQSWAVVSTLAIEKRRALADRRALFEPYMERVIDLPHTISFTRATLAVSAPAAEDGDRYTAYRSPSRGESVVRELARRAAVDVDGEEVTQEAKAGLARFVFHSRRADALFATPPLLEKIGVELERLSSENGGLLTGLSTAAGALSWFAQMGGLATFGLKKLLDPKDLPEVGPQVAKSVDEMEAGAASAMKALQKELEAGVAEYVLLLRRAAGGSAKAVAMRKALGAAAEGVESGVSRLETALLLRGGVERAVARVPLASRKLADALELASAVVTAQKNLDSLADVPQSLTEASLNANFAASQMLGKPPSWEPVELFLSTYATRHETFETMRAALSELEGEGGRVAGFESSLGARRRELLSALGEWEWLLKAGSFLSECAGSAVRECTEAARRIVDDVSGSANVGPKATGGEVYAAWVKAISRMVAEGSPLRDENGFASELWKRCAPGRGLTTSSPRGYVEEGRAARVFYETLKGTLTTAGGTWFCDYKGGKGFGRVWFGGIARPLSNDRGKAYLAYLAQDGNAYGAPTPWLPAHVTKGTALEGVALRLMEEYKRLKDAKAGDAARKRGDGGCIVTGGSTKVKRNPDSTFDCEAVLTVSSTLRAKARDGKDFKGGTGYPPLDHDLESCIHLHVFGRKSDAPAGNRRPAERKAEEATDEDSADATPVNVPEAPAPSPVPESAAREIKRRPKGQAGARKPSAQDPAVRRSGRIKDSGRK